MQQVCRQAERAAWLTLQECDATELAGATVLGVEPAPDAGRLRVIVGLPGRADAEGFAGAQRAAEALGGPLREVVAAWLHRRRVPELRIELHPMEDES